MNKQVKQIRQEIERLKRQLIRGACAAQIEMETNCKDEAYNEVLSFIDSLPDEHHLIDGNKMIEPSKKEKMLYDLNRTLVHFWIDNGHPDNATRIELLERMLHWYKNQGTITLDEKQQPVMECNDLEVRKQIEELANDWHHKGFASDEDCPLCMQDLMDILWHFYELGFNARKEE